MERSTYIRAGHYYTVAGAAYAMGCTDGRIRQLVRAGELAAIRIGQRGYLIPSKAIAADAKKQRKTGRPRTGKK